MLSENSMRFDVWSFAQSLAEKPLPEHSPKEHFWRGLALNFYHARDGFTESEQIYVWRRVEIKKTSFILTLNPNF